MKMQLQNEKIQWQEKEQALISEIHRRDSELTALEHEIREAAKTIEELKSANREAEDVTVSSPKGNKSNDLVNRGTANVAMSRATCVHPLQSKLGDALHVQGVMDMRQDFTKRFPLVRELINAEIKLLQSIQASVPRSTSDSCGSPH